MNGVTLLLNLQVKYHRIITIVLGYFGVLHTRCLHTARTHAELPAHSRAQGCGRAVWFDQV